MDSKKLADFVVDKLEDIKAQDIVVLDVKKQTSVTDYMVIASGTSTQHVRAVSQNLLREAKKHHLDILGSEGEESAEWVLIDLGDAIVHVMMPATRAYYELEKLWSVDEEPKVKKSKAKKTAAKKPASKKAPAKKTPVKRPAAKKAPAKKKPVAKK